MKTLTLLAASAPSMPDITSFLVRLLIVLAVCGLLAYLLTISPIQEPWKRWINAILIAIPVAYLIFFLVSFL